MEGSSTATVAVDTRVTTTDNFGVLAESESLPAADPAPASPPDTDSGSLADHERQFSRRSTQIADEILTNRPDQRANTESATPPAEVAPETDAETDEQKTERERDEHGRFVAGSHRAKKHDAQIRIDNLTRQLREVERERDEFRSRVAIPSSAEPPRAQPAAPPPQVASPSAPPTPDKYDDYSKFIADLTQYQVEQHWQKLEAQRQQKEQQLAAQREQERLRSSWTQRVNAAKTEFPDFESVALESPTQIPPGSLIDAWILEHPSGARVLYDLQKSPAKLQELLAKPLFEQAEALALLSQKPAANGSTGASAATPRNAGPKPPTPVRTSALTAGDEPPDEERTGLAEHERYYPQRRRHG